MFNPRSSIGRGLFPDPESENVATGVRVPTHGISGETVSRLKVTIEVDEVGVCCARMDFAGHELEADGSTPRETLQNLSEIVALYEDHEEQ